MTRPPTIGKRFLSPSVPPSPRLAHISMRKYAYGVPYHRGGPGPGWVMADRVGVSHGTRRASTWFRVFSSHDSLVVLASDRPASSPRVGGAPFSPIPDPLRDLLDFLLGSTWASLVARNNFSLSYPNLDYSLQSRYKVWELNFRVSSRVVLR
ncbi:hypothetical protein H6P81_004119 [Aristolochia fimbriata]|uniref:Uncharacterized protein n=1 Tax=Aristolochia fimbriata TaxID=158543 RepID=A0AAV7FH84_ARIFI|nr:hypothetical protein H6P81_004119 [Aristolochia fimbriata]